MNSYETEKMKKQFEEAGNMIVAFDEVADVYIINTCTVTNIADRKSRKMLHRAKRLNPSSVVVAAGCYVDSAKAKGETDDSVDLYIGNTDKEDVVGMVRAKAKECGILIEEQENKSKNVEKSILTEKVQEEVSHTAKMSEAAQGEEHTRAYIQVQNGCNQYCTYCIIPYVRGPLHSRSVEDVTAEVEKLAMSGYQEVVITGIHLSSYGVDAKKSGSFLELKGVPLLELLESVSRVDGIERIRLGSLEPRIITEEFVQRLSEIAEICPHFHLSLQSGCDTVLQRMNRHYSAEEYLEKLAILRKYFKNPAVTTDIIVGFPQETEEEFKTTMQFAKDAAFAQIHVFKYSRRQGTIADNMDGQITEAVKAERSERLLVVEKELEQKYQQISLEEKEEVLIEEISQIDGKSYLTGYNERYIRIAIPAEEVPDAVSRCNTIATVKIEGNLNETVVLASFC